MNWMYSVIPILGGLLLIAVAISRRWITVPTFAGWNVNPWVTTNWAYLLVPPLVAAFALVAFWWLFPVWFTRYQAWGGPTWELVIAAFLLGLVTPIPMSDSLRYIARIGVLVFIVIAIVWTLFIRAPFFEPPCPRGNTACEKARLDASIAAEQRKAAQKAAEEQNRIHRVAPKELDYCNSERRLYDFKARQPAEPFNRGSQCSYLVWLDDGQCVYFRQKAGQTPLGPYCFQKGKHLNMPDNAVWVWSAGTPFTNYIQLNPRNIVGIIGWRQP